jgi:hypothetical protein
MTNEEILERASEMAEETLVDEMGDGIWVTEENGDVRLNEEAQGRFNDIYEHNLDLLRTLMG